MPSRPPRTTAKPSCPSCRSTKVLPIRFGFPSQKMLDAAKRGEISLGGCVIEKNPPKWHCLDCEAEF